jgi:hypothetical protein
MTTIAFWNAASNVAANAIALLAKTTATDILLIAEQEQTPFDVLAALNVDEAAYSYAPSIGNSKIHMYVRFSEDLVEPVFETDRLTIRRVRLPNLPTFLLAAAHFPAKNNWSDASQTAECIVIASDIRATEDREGHRRTVLVGDLNMNPFEDGLVEAVGLHGVSTKALAAQKSREIQGREYPFFYNPMWGTLGDHSPGPPGTYYHRRSEHRVYFWNAFDQVLIRPEMLDHFQSSSLKILDEFGGISLSRPSGVPNATENSDHYPIVFSLI